MLDKNTGEKISNGKDHKNLEDGTIPVYGSGGIMRYANKSIYGKESVLIPRKGSIGNVFYVNSPFWTVDTIFYTIINCDKISPRFFYYFLKNSNLEELNFAGGVPSLTKTILDKILIPLPPLTIQQEIVNILDKFTQLEAELEAELEARKKQYEYYRNELLNFEGEEVEWKTLGDVGKICMCKRIMKNETSSTGDIPFFKIGTFGREPDAYISQEKYNEYRKAYSFPKKGDILINGLNLNYDFVSQRVACAPNDGIITSAYLVCRPRKGVFYNYYTYLFKAMDGMKLFHGMGSGIRLTLSFKELKKQMLPVPPLSEQQTIVSYITERTAKIDSLIEKLNKEIECIKEYKQRLISDVVTGQIKVS